jgi:hypothetical protein
VQSEFRFLRHVSVQIVVLRVVAPCLKVGTNISEEHAASIFMIDLVTEICRMQHNFLPSPYL